MSWSYGPDYLRLLYISELVALTVTDLVPTIMIIKLTKQIVIYY